MVSDHIRSNILGCMKLKRKQSYNEPEEKRSNIWHDVELAGC